MYAMSGSRFDSAETSGTSALLLQMLVRSDAFKKGVAQLGAKVHIHADREIQGVTLAVFNDQVSSAVDLLTKVFSRDTQLSEVGFEAEKEILHRRAMEVQRDQFEQTQSCLFETTFEDHTMGLPLLGLRDNARNLTLKQLETHRDRTFTGPRMALVITGNPSNPEQTLENAQAAMSKIPSDATMENNEFYSVSLEKPLLTSTVMNVRDDEMSNLNVGVSYLTGNYASENHFFYMLFQEMVGDFNAHEDGSAHVNSSDRQYNLGHTWLGDAPGINLHVVRYLPFSDGGLFTNFTHGHEIWGYDMMLFGQFLNTEFTKQITLNDVYRARARVFNNLLQNSRVSVKNNLGIGRDLLYTGRRIGRNEIAKRVSAISETTHLQKKAKKLFYDKDIAVVTYGPQHMIDHVNYFGRKMRVSTLHNTLIKMNMIPK